MSEQQEKYNVPLSVMVESAEEFVVRGTKYLVRPLFLEEISEFNRDGLSIGPQFINLADEERAKTLDKWISRILFDKDGSPLSLQQLKEKHWNIKDLRKVLQKIIDLSD
jgi:hypothetical protein